jgi:predicted glycosyltransferase
MRALFELTHPAHVHLFRHAIEALESAGHAVAVTAREKDLTTDLLAAYGVDHSVLSAKRGGTAAMPREWVPRTLRLLRFARDFDPDVIVSRRNPASAGVAATLSVPHVMFHDTEAVSPMDWLTCPAATLVCTPSTFERSVPGRQRRYDGYQELAYLHPERFDPDPSVLTDHGVDPDAPYSVVRFVSNDAFHDVGHAGFSPAAKRDLIADLADRGPVYVTSEATPPDDLDAEPSPVPPEAIHHLLAFSDLYVGDSGTMATEAALLGTPTVRLAVIDRPFGNFEELGDRGLMVSTPDEREALAAAADLAADPDAGERWERRRDALMAEKVDVTAFTLDCLREVTA